MRHVIDLRSDTVTRPTRAMRAAMAEAEVGDDVYGEDPTVNRLQRVAADLLGKEESLFVPSGTMGNLICVLVHAARGQEVILGDESHIYHYEQGGASAVGSCIMHPVATRPDGMLALDAVRWAIRDKDNVHSAAPGVICIENTHNRCGGAVLSRGYCDQVRAVGAEFEIPLHLDGARLANAAVALKVPICELAEPFDSVQFDLSKGLGAPVGGIIAGSHGFIGRAKRYRKLLGGGMRQAGVLAAAGIIAIENMIGRLEEDHVLAKRLVEMLAVRPELTVAPNRVMTNIVMVGVKPPRTVEGLLRGLRDRDILANSPGAERIRFVTHYDVSAADVERVIDAVHQILDGDGSS